MKKWEFLIDREMQEKYDTLMFHPILLRMVIIRRQSANVDVDVEKRNYNILLVQTLQKSV